MSPVNGSLDISTSFAPDTFPPVLDSFPCSRKEKLLLLGDPPHAKVRRVFKRGCSYGGKQAHPNLKPMNLKFLSFKVYQTFDFKYLCLFIFHRILYGLAGARRRTRPSFMNARVIRRWHQKPRRFMLLRKLPRP